jgi:hypothetical protein
MRAVRRLSVDALHPRSWTQGVVVPAYWWDGHPNFGDDMTPWLLPAYGLLPVHREPDRARLAGAGSVIDFLPETFDGVVWGSGSMSGDPHPLPFARVLAVRGELTRELVGADAHAALGDPGLLVARRAPRPAVRWTVGIVPHGHHRSHAQFLGLARPGEGHHVVDVHQSARSAVHEIAACEAIVTTSLHGLVTADAYGIPAVWTVLDPPLHGGDFKFRDYESAVTPGRTRFVPFGEGIGLADIITHARTVDPDAVGHLAVGLETTLASVPEMLGGLPRFPAGLIAAMGDVSAHGRCR